jgi:succinate dehydrogenase / fumarate reductase cytochrome b subunit
MTGENRPLSPHLQIYRPQLTSVLSIVHRMTGVALSAGMLLLVVWLVSAASGEASYQQVHGIASGWLGQLVLVGVSFAFFFHLANGIRHLAWDAGWGFEISQAYTSGWMVIVFCLAATAGFWWLVLA